VQHACQAPRVSTAELHSVPERTRKVGSIEKGVTYVRDPQKPTADITTTFGAITKGKHGRLLHAEIAWTLYSQLTGPYVWCFAGSAAACAG